MKYWENGFYLTQNANNSRKEISDEYWQELLQGQNNGMIIAENEQGLPVLKPNEMTEQEKLQNEYDALVAWFDIDYARKEQKYRRLHTLGDPVAYDALLSLYQRAETQRARIQELEVLLGK